MCYLEAKHVWQRAYFERLLVFDIPFGSLLVGSVRRREEAL